MHHAMNGEYAGFFDIGMVERNEVNAIIVHGTMCLIRRAALEAAGNWPSDTIVEDTDLGLTILEHGWLALLYQPPLRPRPAAGHLRGLQEAAPPLGLWRLPDHQEALAPLPARREPAHARPAARVRARLAQLAGRREPRRRGGDHEPDLGAGRRLRRHRHSRQDPDLADHRRVRGLAAAFRLRSTGCASRSRSGRRSCAAFAAMSLQWTVAQGDGRRPDQGPPAVRAHSKGGWRAQRRTVLPGVLGGGARRAVDHRRRRSCSRPTVSRFARSTSSPPCW